MVKNVLSVLERTEGLELVPVSLADESDWGTTGYASSTGAAPRSSSIVKTPF